MGYGVVEAVNDYVDLVLVRSIFPDGFEVNHDAEFDLAGAELTARIRIPSPDQIPTVKSFRYAKATDEISQTDLPQRDAKLRYASVVHQVALRTLHEVFEADRRNIVRAISLEVGTDANDPATGRMGFIPFVAVGIDRARLESIELAGVVPSATLEHLGAAISKNPFDLVAVSGAGVR